MSEPAYTRLPVDERRAQIVAAGTTVFAEHAYEEISMREIASAAGVSKALLYHYFPSKIDLFKEAVSEAAGELAALIRPASDGTGAPAPEQLAATLDAYLAWIDDHARTWTKLMQSAATLPEAREIVERFRAETMATGAGRASVSEQRPSSRRSGPRSSAGSASWTPRSSTGPRTATSPETSSGTCSSRRSARPVLAGPQ